MAHWSGKISSIHLEGPGPGSSQSVECVFNNAGAFHFDSVSGAAHLAMVLCATANNLTVTVDTDRDAKLVNLDVSRDS